MPHHHGLGAVALVDHDHGFPGLHTLDLAQATDVPGVATGAGLLLPDTDRDPVRGAVVELGHEDRIGGAKGPKGESQWDRDLGFLKRHPIFPK